MKNENYFNSFSRIRSIRQEVAGHTGMIYLISPNGATLTFQAGWGYSADHKGIDYKLSQGFVGVSAKTGKVLRSGNLHRALTYTRAVRTKIETSPLKSLLRETVPMPGLPQVESMMAVPLKTRAGIIGVILVESAQSNVFGEIDEELLLLVAGETARLITEVRQEEHKRHQLEAVNQVKLHLERLNAFLDTVTSAAAITESSTYAGAMAKQLKGLVNASKEAGLAKVYFEQAADVFQGIGIEFGGGTEQAGSSLAFSFRESGGGLFRLERVLDLVRGQSGKEICGSDQGDIKRNQAVG